MPGHVAASNLDDMNDRIIVDMPSILLIIILERLIEHLTKRRGEQTTSSLGKLGAQC